ncbi:MAG: amidohydrolase [Deltaproteobacteria bacterium]|nr:amidohydrolase [Deltaproteobacteria bacterium]
MVIDFHTHIFPDKIAASAIPRLEEAGGIKAFCDGTRRGLLESMQHAGIAKSVVCTIATKPEQFETILTWADSLRSEQLIPFPSVHPAAPDCLTQIDRIKKAGFVGIKLHPYYQNFFIDDDRLMPIYERISGHGLILLMHTGFDLAFPKIRRADPAKIIKVASRFPQLKLVTSHLGAWRLWDEVLAQICGREIYMDISFALDILEPEKARTIISEHPPDYILFASDSPWTDQAATLELLAQLELEPELHAKILGGNARKLLEL